MWSPEKKSGWDVRRSQAASTVNPIRSIVENLRMDPDPDKTFIALSIGDPTIFRNLNASPVVVDAVVEAVKSLKYNGYANSLGHEEAREAVAKSSSTSGVTYTAEDIILTSGCSAALDSCITCLAEPGQNILVPKPGFSIYKTIADGMGIQVKYYSLLPEKEWRVDLDEMEEQIDSETVAIIVNNPSNPCGSVYSAQHLLDIVAVARRNYLPIIADEVYEYMVFKDEIFVPLASLSKDVPVLSCSGLTKRYLIPGWRVGWIKIHDPKDILREEVRAGLIALNQKTLGCNTIMQGALPKILSQVPDAFFEKTVDTIERNANLAFKKLSTIAGLHPIMPKGAMYMMVGIDLSVFPKLKTEIQFIEQMVKEESVFCLPGTCFKYPGYLRLVLTVPEEFVTEACQRIEDFCSRHFMPEALKGKNGVSLKKMTMNSLKTSGNYIANKKTVAATN